MPDPKKKKHLFTKELVSKPKPHQTSDMIGLPDEWKKTQEKIMKEGSSGPRYKQDTKGKYYSNSTPLKQQVMKTTSKMKTAAAKAKTPSAAMQKKEMMGKKMTPAKMKKC
jgi:hypothetical protein